MLFKYFLKIEYYFICFFKIKKIKRYGFDLFKMTEKKKKKSYAKKLKN